MAATGPATVPTPFGPRPRRGVASVCPPGRPGTSGLSSARKSSPNVRGSTKRSSPAGPPAEVYHQRRFLLVNVAFLLITSACFVGDAPAVAPPTTPPAVAPTDKPTTPPAVAPTDKPTVTPTPAPPVARRIDASLQRLQRLQRLRRLERLRLWQRLRQLQRLRLRLRERGAFRPAAGTFRQQRVRLRLRSRFVVRLRRRRPFLPLQGPVGLAVVGMRLRLLHAGAVVRLRLRQRAVLL